MSKRKIQSSPKRGAPRTKTPKVYSKNQIAKIDRLARAQCKDATIATILGVDDETFKREFGERTRQKRDEGKAAILQAQLKMAKSQPIPAIWFGKQHLDQSDRNDVRMSGNLTVQLVDFGKAESQAFNDDGSKREDR